jgi:L-ornithine Nalpha-acyltransferase
MSNLIPTLQPSGRGARFPARFMKGLGWSARPTGLRRGLAGRTARPAPQPPGLQGVLGRIGSLEVRLATTRKDVRRAQRLRYRVFCQEMSAVPDMVSRLKRRDVDAYDSICDHLLVIDREAPAGRRGEKPGGRRKPRVVGTYRLLRQEVAEAHAGFYSAGEFDVAPLIAASPGRRFLELGRSCVLAPYRDRRTVELLWHGIWTYVRHHGVDVMFGCASLEGTDPDQCALPLSFLHHHAAAPPEWRARALPRRYVPMDRLPREAIDARRALHSLPPLIKGYLRVGATFGDGAVIDRQFGTIDVLVILPVEAINPRYVNHFGPDAERHAA